MNIINDKYYNDARQFIQTHFQDESLSDAIKNKLSELYNSLNSENAQSIYNEANKIYYGALKQNQLDFMLQRNELIGQYFVILGIIFLLGAAFKLVGYIGKKYTFQYPRLNNIWKYINRTAIVTMSLSAVGIFVFALIFLLGAFELVGYIATTYIPVNFWHHHNI